MAFPSNPWEANRFLSSVAEMKDTWPGQVNTQHVYLQRPQGWGNKVRLLFVTTVLRQDLRVKLLNREQEVSVVA